MARPDLHRLLYVSSAVQELSARALEDLLALARAKNRARDVSGVLLYADGNFMQLLEGPRETVRATFRHIERDARHHGLIVLLDAPADERLFSQWSMAYSAATWGELGDVRAACRTSTHAAVQVLKGFAVNTSRFAIP